MCRLRPAPINGLERREAEPFAPGAAPVEQIQYVEADGTLVTMAGFRPTNRRAREGGEPWTDAVDQGPGNYLTFPTFYFQNRTYGLVIRDEVPAGRQKITVYLKPNVGTFINNGFSAFRRIDADVIEYGWKMGVGVRQQGRKQPALSRERPARRPLHRAVDHRQLALGRGRRARSPAPGLSFARVARCSHKWPALAATSPS